MQIFLLPTFVSFSIFVKMNANNHIFKEVNITPAFKKGYRGSNENYRPMNILPVIVKIFEKLLIKQGTMFMDQVLSKYGFRKSCIAQHCPLVT